MTDDEIAWLHNMALGEALFASALAQGVFALVTQKWGREQIRQIVDAMLLTLEQNQGAAKGRSEAIEHARVRMAALLSVYAE